MKKPKISLRDKFPNILKEWAFTRNILIPEHCSPRSAAKVEWKCHKCEEYWAASIGNRTPPKNSGCPFCSGHRVSDKNRLSIHFPELVKEWNYSENDKSPDEVGVSSSYLAIWNCKKCKRTYDARVHSRTQRGNKCPYCSGQRISDMNRLS